MRRFRSLHPVQSACLLLAVGTSSTRSFSIQHRTHRSFDLAATPTPSATSTSETISRAAPRTGVLQSLLNLVLESPLWTYVLVPQARQKMVDTASANGIPWKEYLDWIESQPDGPWHGLPNLHTELVDKNVLPDYYQAPFHAYTHGNLEWQAALEVEIASAAVGARNFPAYGREGETAFRGAFRAALDQAGASVPPNATLVDLGCGTGLSTRPLAAQYPDAHSILGLDLSPYYCAVGNYLLEYAKQHGRLESGPWVNTIVPDDRIELRVADAAATGLPDNSVDVVNLQFVCHEMPASATLSILAEAHRILRDGGQLWFSEMDFETPGYKAQRENPLLFALIRATEPYLDEYADAAADVRACLKQLFATTVIQPATGRHFAMVATKQSDVPVREHVLRDERFDANGEYKLEDTHLVVFDNKLKH